jgi:hypothetical protein
MCLVEGEIVQNSSTFVAFSIFKELSALPKAPHDKEVVFQKLKSSDHFLIVIVAKNHSNNP